MTLPTAEDFGLGPLDEKCAREHFLGRTLTEAEALFRDLPHLYFEDLLWMGPVAFCFYFPAAVRALLNGAADGDLYPLDSFAGTLEHRLSFQPEVLRPASAHLAEACRDILAAFGDTFVGEADIYGDLQSRYTALQHAFTKSAA